MEATYHNETTQRKPDISQSCFYCGSQDLFTKEKTPHVGLFCARCGRWIKWLPQGRPVVAMPFGKHRGTPISDLPDDYLNWILENLELKGSLLRALEAEYERRGRTAA